MSGNTIEILRVSFDIGGVVSKYPEIFRPLIEALQASCKVEVYFLTDMTDKQAALKMLRMNGIHVEDKFVLTAPYPQYGEACKSVVSRRNELHVHIDDFPAYVAEGAAVRLLLMPDISRPYYARDWLTDGSEGTFGRVALED